MTKVHWFIVVMAAGAVFAQIMGLKNWHDALSPVFIGGTGLAVVATLKAIFTDKAGA